MNLYIPTRGSLACVAAVHSASTPDVAAGAVIHVHDCWPVARDGTPADECEDNAKAEWLFVQRHAGDLGVLVRFHDEATDTERKIPAAAAMAPSFEERMKATARAGWSRCVERATRSAARGNLRDAADWLRFAEGYTEFLPELRGIASSISFGSGVDGR